MSALVGDKVIGSATVEEPCDLRINRRDLKEHRETLNEADAVLVISCRAGSPDRRQVYEQADPPSPKHLLNRRDDMDRPIL